MENWQKNLPMQLTWSRVVLTVPIVALLYPNSDWPNAFAALLFILASFTDYLDGYYARKFQVESNLGKFMDPVADKILVSGILLMMILHRKVDPFLVILLVSRDTYIGGIRAIASADGLVLSAQAAGKWKTALQMGCIPVLMIGDLSFLHILPFHLGQLGYGLLWFSALLSISSAWQYHQAYQKARRHY